MEGCNSDIGLTVERPTSPGARPVRLTTYTYGTLKRLGTVTYPVPQADGTAPTEQFTYNANANFLKHTLRDDSFIQYTYDNLDRVTLKDLPGTEADCSYT